MMITYLKRNTLSILIGVLVGLPLSLYAVHQQRPSPAPIYHELVLIEQFNVKTEQIELDEPPTVEVEALNVDFQNYEMTTEDLAEEEYFDSLELLALCVEAEAENQGLIGKKYVCDVILNRVDDEDFPDNITDVIMQKNQFSVVLDGRIWEMEPTEETYQAIREELDQRTNYDVLYFTSEGFHPCGKAWEKIGDHYFSTKKEG